MSAQSYGADGYDASAHWMTPYQVVVQFLLGSAVGGVFGLAMGAALVAAR